MKNAFVKRLEEKIAVHCIQWYLNKKKKQTKQLHDRRFYNL